MGNKNKGFINKNVTNKESITKYINQNASKLLGNNENGDDSKVIISFLHVQNDFQCFSSWSKQEMNDFWNFYKKIHEYTWSQVYSTGRKSQKNGFAYTIIPASKYPNPEFKNQLSKDITLFELRISQKGRVHGFRDKSVMYICWLDRNHNIT